jgi:hypothetical protein
MTDKEKFIAFFKSFGIDLTPQDNNLLLEEDCMQDNPKVKGYCGFYTIFNFDSNGNFVDCGAYE